MTTGKWILCLIASSITSSYVTFHLNQPSRNQSDVASIKENSSHIKIVSVSAAEQSQKLTETKKEIGNIHDSHQINLSQKASFPADTDASKVNQAQSALEFAYEKKQNEIASFRDFTERTGDSVLSVITKNYDSEPVDSEWARSKEDELLAIMDTNKTLQNVAPLELSCKSQNCRLVLSAHDENQSQSVYSAFKDGVLQGSEENKKQVISYFNSPERGEIHIYLSKSTVRELIDGKVN
jgi:hypothetical protein